jgi:hypothetical protein
MKKQTKSTAYEQQADPMHSDIELASEDDDIIDLEDIIEMPDRPIDEDEDLDLDVEILDVSSDFEHEQQSPRIERPPGSGDKDLIGVFGDESEDTEAFFDEIASGKPAKKTVDIEEPKVFGDEEASLLDELMDETRIPESGAGEQDKDTDLIEKVAAELEILEEAPSVEIPPEPAPAAPLDQEPMPVPLPVDFSETAEELIGRIESRLQEHIRVMVESRLPDLVRSIISEEIEKIKREPH